MKADQAKPPRGRRAKPLRAEELCNFTEGLAVLVGAGLPLDHVLETVSFMHDSGRVRALTAEMLLAVRGGASLTRAMAEQNGVFSPAYLGLVQAGELSGALAKVLDELAKGLRRNLEIKRHLLTVLLYPAVLLAVSFLAIVFIMVYVLPTFVGVFNDMSTPLPPTAAFLLGLGSFMKENSLLLGLAFAAALGVVFWAMGNQAARQVIDRALLRFGPQRNVLANWLTSQYFRTLGLLVEGGVPLPEACRQATAAVGNRHFRRGLAGVEALLKEGRGLGGALAAGKVIPAAPLRMVVLGEEAANLPTMLDYAARHLENKVKTDIDRVVRLVEPAIILIMGVVVGFIVVTMINTILSLTQGGI